MLPSNIIKDKDYSTKRCTRRKDIEQVSPQKVDKFERHAIQVKNQICKRYEYEISLIVLLLHTVKMIMSLSYECHSHRVVWNICNVCILAAHLKGKEDIHITSRYLYCFRNKETRAISLQCCEVDILWREHEYYHITKASGYYCHRQYCLTLSDATLTHLLDEGNPQLSDREA